VTPQKLRPARASSHRANREEPSEPLFSPNDAQGFRYRWEKIQIGFVDEPHNAVKQADDLVAETIKRLAEVFAPSGTNSKRHGIRTTNLFPTEDFRSPFGVTVLFDRLLSVYLAIST